MKEGGGFYFTLCLRTRKVYSGCFFPWKGGPGRRSAPNRKRFFLTRAPAGQKKTAHFPIGIAKTSDVENSPPVHCCFRTAASNKKHLKKVDCDRTPAVRPAKFPPKFFETRPREKLKKSTPFCEPVPAAISSPRKPRMLPASFKLPWRPPFSL